MLKSILSDLRCLLHSAGVTNHWNLFQSGSCSALPALSPVLGEFVCLPSNLQGRNLPTCKIEWLYRGDVPYTNAENLM